MPVAAPVSLTWRRNLLRRILRAHRAGCCFENFCFLSWLAGWLTNKRTIRVAARSFDFAKPPAFGCCCYCCCSIAQNELATRVTRRRRHRRLCRLRFRSFRRPSRGLESRLSPWRHRRRLRTFPCRRRCCFCCCARTSPPGLMIEFPALKLDQVTPNRGRRHRSSRGRRRRSR